MKPDESFETAAAGVEVATRHADAPHKPFLRQMEICRRLGISDETWRRWVAQRKAPSPVQNIPGRPRWKVSDIEHFERGLYGAGGGRVFFGAARRRA